MRRKLKIIAYSDERMRTRVGEWTAQLNPENYAQSFRTLFSEDDGIDTAGVVSRFRSQQSEELRLELMIDATGAVPLDLHSALSGAIDLPSKIDQLKEIIYSYNGEIHSQNYLQLLWGTLSFNCMLASLNVEYQLFTPEGVPLRAKLNLDLKQHQTPDELARRSRKASPDLTHSRTVEAGKTLPLLCHEVYGEPHLYPAVARANDLDDLMSLPAGSRLRFPRLEM